MGGTPGIRCRLGAALAAVVVCACADPDLLPDGGRRPPPPDSGLPLLSDGGRAHCDPTLVADPLVVHVDPLLGDDLQGTGSARAQGAPEPACAYRSLTRALALGRAAAVVRLHLVVDAPGTLGSETFPVVLPRYTILEGQGARLASFSASALEVRGSSLVQDLVVDCQGTAAVGVLVDDGPIGGGVGLLHSTVTGCTLAGVRVAQQGQLSLRGGRLHHNAVGLQVLDQGLAFISPGEAVPSLPVEVSASAGDGVQVRGTAQLGVLTGADPAQVVLAVTDNARHGISVQHDVSTDLAASPSASFLVHTVATGNGASGLHLGGGSALRVRTSDFRGNRQHGVHVETAPDFQLGVNTGNQLLGLDLGTLDQPGGNVLQDLDLPNGRSGLCLQLTSTWGLRGALQAGGNRFALDGGAVDCASDAVALPVAAGCLEGPVGVAGVSTAADLALGRCSAR